MGSTIHQPHDKFFKLSLGELQVAQDFLQAYLPSRLLQKIDFSTLELEKNSFINETYKANEADVIYKVKLSGHAAYIYVLCEQQTEVDPEMAFRLLVYSVRLMESHRRQYPADTLPFVYPMVVYSGDKVWNAPLEIFPLFGEQESLAREVFLQSYQLLDLQRMSDEELQKQELSRVVTFALKYRQIRNFATFLEKVLPQMRSLEKHPPGLYLAKIVLQYIIDGVEANEIPVFYEQINHYLSPQLKGEAMTLAECLRQQGVQEGMQQGVQQGMQQGEVAVVTRLIQRRFGVIPAIYLEKISAADTHTLLEWSEKILDAHTLDEVFH